MSLGKIEAQDIVKVKTVPAFTEVETYTLGDVNGQKGWFRLPDFPSPRSRLSVIGGSPVEGVQALAVQIDAGASDCHYGRILPTPIVPPYSQLELTWKTKVLSTGIGNHSFNLSFCTVDVPTQAQMQAALWADFPALLWFASDLDGLVDMFTGLNLDGSEPSAGVFSDTGMNDNAVHSWKALITIRGAKQNNLTQFYRDGVLVATKEGGGGDFRSASGGNASNDPVRSIVLSSSHNDPANDNKDLYDSIQIKVTR